MKFKAWQWFFYIFGWVTGIFSTLFWLFQYAMYLCTEGQDKFFDNNFHRRVWKWGIFMFLALILAISIALPELLSKS